MAGRGVSTCVRWIHVLVCMYGSEVGPESRQVRCCRTPQVVYVRGCVYQGACHEVIVLNSTVDK